MTHIGAVSMLRHMQTGNITGMSRHMLLNKLCVTTRIGAVSMSRHMGGGGGWFHRYVAGRRKRLRERADRLSGEGGGGLVFYCVCREWVLYQTI